MQIPLYFTCCRFFSLQRNKTILNLNKSLNRYLTTMASENQNKKLRTDSKVIGTHSGTFHCDEVLGCFLLKQLPEYKDAKIFRSRNNAELKENCDIIIDVGGEFDHELKLYDHHQKTFQSTLSSLKPELGNEFNIRLSSAGLVYTYYGERVLDEILKREANLTLTPDNLRLTYIQIYRNFIQEIDAIDNGVPICESIEPLYKISTDISSRIGKFNPSWVDAVDDTQDAAALQLKRFEKAMQKVGEEFIEKVIEIGNNWIKAREYVREALVNAKSVHESGEILMLNKFCPWKVHLSDLEKEYNVEGIPKLLLFNEGTTWRVAGVPLTPGSFLGRKFLPKAWHGLANEELSEAAGISDLIFVHHTGFIGGAKNKEAALAMAIKSVQWEEK